MPTPENVRVYLRFRPLNEEELGGGVGVGDIAGVGVGGVGGVAGGGRQQAVASSGSTCARVNESGRTVTLADGGVQHQFKFDSVFDEDATQSTLYEATSAPLVRSFLAGTNCCVMTYGHPGSGKTHTLVGSSRSSSSPAAGGAGGGAGGCGVGGVGGVGDDQSLDSGDVSSLGSSGASEAPPPLALSMAHARHRPTDPTAPASPPSQVVLTAHPPHPPLHSPASDGSGGVGGGELLPNPLSGHPTPMQRMRGRRSGRPPAARGSRQQQRQEAAVSREGDQDDNDDDGNDSGRGIIPRMIRDVFASIPGGQLYREGNGNGNDDDNNSEDGGESEEEEGEFVKVSCSYVEIAVNDKGDEEGGEGGAVVVDLLARQRKASATSAGAGGSTGGSAAVGVGGSSGGGAARIEMREDTQIGGVRFVGARERQCLGEVDAMRLLEQGNAVRRARRRVAGAAGAGADAKEAPSGGGTTTNTRRPSHAIFVIDLERHDPSASSMVKSRMLLVDLGGGVMSASLSALGNVVYALTERSVQGQVPYGASVLTSVLRNVIGGNSKTALILTASPSSSCVNETVFTIRFGQRARHVLNAVKTNRIQMKDEYYERERASRRRRKKEKEKKKKDIAAGAAAVAAAPGNEMPGGESATSKAGIIIIPADSSPAEGGTEDTVQTDASSNDDGSKDAYGKLMRARAMLETNQSGSNKSFAVDSVQGAAKQMEADLSSARQELSTVSSLLRSAAERMEADLSAAKKELTLSSPTPEFGSQKSGGSKMGIGSGALATKRLSLALEQDDSLEQLPLHLTAQQISLDLEAARRELMGVASDVAKASPSDDLGPYENGTTRKAGEGRRKEVKDATGGAKASDLGSSSEQLPKSGDLESDTEGALPNPTKQRKKDEAMEKEIAALRKENEALNRVKKKSDEELVRAKKEIKILTLRATEAERSIRKSEYRGAKYNNATNSSAIVTTGEGGTDDDNLGVSNIVSGQFQSGSTNDTDSSSHRTDDMVVDKENIRVCLRLRPMSKLETSRRSRRCFDIHDGSKNFTVESLGGEYDFSYDKVYESGDSQSNVYAFAGSPVVSDLLLGVNCCVMVYGLTSSGKTYTLMGRLPDASGRDADDVDLSEFGDASRADGFGDDPEAGIAPRLIKNLFKGIAEAPEETEFTIKCSFVGIYMEKMFDLLQSQEKKNLFVRDDPRGIQVENACEVCCFDKADVFALLQRGQACLQVLAHRMNVDINRSHSVFIVKVEQRNIKTGATKTAQLHLADLAGFEMPVKTKGQTMQELKIVHKSFSALGNVIKSLMENNVHAPYRESKLTCILKDALGGNCKTTLIVTASPSSYSISETVNTIRIGQRVRRVVNMPRVNREVSIEDYKNWLMTTEVKLGELVAFVKEIAGELHREGNEESGDEAATVSRILSGELWTSINAIVEDEETVNNPCRQALSLGDMEEIQKCGAKWKALSTELVTRIRSDELAEVIKARAKAESLLSDIQSEVVVLRRQNDLLAQDKRKKGEEVSKLKKELKLLQLRIAELEHNLNLSQYREKEAGVFLRQLRKICWNLQKDIHTERAPEIAEITASLAGSPDLTGLVDLDTLLLESGLIGTRDIDEEDLDEDDETNFLDWSQTRRDSRRDSGNDLPGSYSTEDPGRHDDHTNAKAGLSIMRGVTTFLRKGADPLEPSDADDSSSTQPMHTSSQQQRKLQKDLRNMTNKCVELQMLLNEERERMNALTNRARSLNVKNLSQEVIALGKERDITKHHAKAATWKLQELHVVNKVLSKKGKETTEHVSSLEEGFQRLQETFRTTVLDSLEADSQLNEKITSLEAVVDSLTVPQNQNTDLDVLARPVPRMNLPLRGRLESKRDGGESRSPNMPSPGARCLMLANSLKLPEQTPSSCVRRSAKYRKRSKKAGDAGAAGLGKAALASRIQRRRRLQPPQFSGNLFLLESLLSID